MLFNELIRSNLKNEKSSPIISELSNQLLSHYKTNDAGDADLKGDNARVNKRVRGIISATKQQFANNAKQSQTENTADPVGPVIATGYAYNHRDQRIVWSREFPDEKAAKDWANQKNATIIKITPKTAAPQKSVEEGTNCVPISEDCEQLMSAIIHQILLNETVQNNRR